MYIWHLLDSMHACLTIRVQAALKEASIIGQHSPVLATSLHYRIRGQSQGHFEHMLKSSALYCKAGSCLVGGCCLGGVQTQPQFLLGLCVARLFLSYIMLAWAVTNSSNNTIMHVHVYLPFHLVIHYCDILIYYVY